MERWIERLIDRSWQAAPEELAEIIRSLLYEISEINDRLKELENK